MHVNDGEEHVYTPEPCPWGRLVNLKQKVVVWIGLLLIVAMGLCPPWVQRFAYSGFPFSAYTIKSLLNLAEDSKLQLALASESSGMM